jgi:hypothetical protein
MRSYTTSDSRNASQIQQTFSILKPLRALITNHDVVDEGGVGDGVVPVERLHRRVVDGLVRGDVDRGLARAHGAEREVWVHAAPVVGADVPELGFACSNQQREGKIRIKTRFSENGTMTIRLFPQGDAGKSHVLGSHARQQAADNTRTRTAFPLEVVIFPGNREAEEHA